MTARAQMSIDAARVLKNAPCSYLPGRLVSLGKSRLGMTRFVGVSMPSRIRRRAKHRPLTIARRLGALPVLAVLVTLSPGCGTNPLPNQAPMVAIAPVPPGGPSPTIAWLDGTVTDDGLPDDYSMQIRWSQVSGPANVVFDNPQAEDTRVTIPTAGRYVLKLTASDGEFRDWANVEVIVRDGDPLSNQAPTVAIAPVPPGGPSPMIAALNGTVADDGLPGGQSIQTWWSQVSGPANVVFDDPRAEDTRVTIPMAGTYVLRLTASDGEFEAWATVDVIVRDGGNEPPSITIASVGPLRPPQASALLDASVVDDGLPNGGGLSFKWCKESGPGIVAFGDRFEEDTTAFFDTAGDYVLRLEANDGDLSSAETVSLTVLEVAALPPPPAGGFLTAVGNDRFGDDPDEVAEAYYRAIDPTDAKDTLDKWLGVNGLNGSPDAFAAFFNAGDLGFGRRMIMKRTGRDIAYAVGNYATVDDAVADVNPVATVTMEYSPGPAGGQPYIKFYAFEDRNGDGIQERVRSVDLDGGGRKPLPALCIVCHGGSPSALDLNGNYPDQGNIGSQFLPFDLESFEYSCETGFSRAEQEADFKRLNEPILETNPVPATRELIEGWYGGSTLPLPTQSSDFVPDGWSGERDVYRTVIARSCRSCHVSRSAPLDFARFDDPVNFLGFKQLGTLIRLDIAQGRMPHAKRTFEKFWLSTAPHQPQVLLEALDRNEPPVGGVQSVLFVRDDAGAGGNGNSWAGAFNSLQSALTAAAGSSGVVEEIWVAGGTYEPSQESVPGEPCSVVFSLPVNVSILGGFAGGETSPDQRDPELNPTTLRAVQLPGCDSGGTIDHILVADANVDSATVLDGFVITGQFSNQQGGIRAGGAMMIEGGSPLVANCVFEDNGPQGNGGAVLVNGGSPSFHNCVFRFNSSSALAGGGAIYIQSGSPTFVNCLIFDNISFVVDQHGGGVYLESGHCELIHCTLTRNGAAGDGAGVYVESGGLVMRGCILWANSGGGQSVQNGQISGDLSASSVTFTCVQDGAPQDGLVFPGVGNIDRDPDFLDFDDSRLSTGSPCINAGSNAALPVDSADLDRDGDRAEVIPIDLAGAARVQEAVVDMGAYEGGLAALRILLSVTSIDVPEDTSASFTVRLSLPPASPVTVTALKVFGDADITIQSGGTLVFDETNFNVPQAVVLFARDDPDFDDGTARFEVSAPLAAGFRPETIVAREIDDDLNGAELYATNCMACHGPLAISTKRGRTAQEIQAAIASVLQMNTSTNPNLGALTEAQVQAIAVALGG